MAQNLEAKSQGVDCFNRIECFDGKNMIDFVRTCDQHSYSKFYISMNPLATARNSWYRLERGKRIVSFGSNLVGSMESSLPVLPQVPLTLK